MLGPSKQPQPGNSVLGALKSIPGGAAIRRVSKHHDRRYRQQHPDGGWTHRQRVRRDFVSRASRQPQRAGAACWPPSPVPEFGLGLVRPPRRRIRWCGRRRRASAARYGVDFDTTPIEAALIGGACSRSRNGSEASAERGGVYLIGANFSRARARRSRATRSASRPTRSSRLGGASPISFSNSSFERFSQRRWSARATGPAIGPTCWRRLLAAVASS